MLTTWLSHRDRLISKSRSFIQSLGNGGCNVWLTNHGSNIEIGLSLNHVPLFSL